MLAGASLPACHRQATDDPAAVYQSVRGDFLSGNLDVAEGRAAKARQQFAGGDGKGTDWAMQFRLLEAETLVYQGRGSDVIARLSEQGVSYPAVGDPAIKRNLLLSLAHANLGQRPQSDRELHEAHRLADQDKSPLLGEVLRTEAQFQVAHKDLPAALGLFQKSLRIAREQNDAYLAATDLLNIGFVSLQRERYDEAISELSGAADFAERIQARVLIQAALGNLGEAYLRLGDFEKALVNYQQAEQQAKQLGAKSSEVIWLQDIGLCYYRLGNLEAAKEFDQLALTPALALRTSAQIVNIDTNLAFLHFRLGQYDLAKSYSDDAIREARTLGDTAEAAYPLFLQALLAARQPNRADAEQMLMQAHQDSLADPSLRWEIENAIANFHAARHDSRKAELWYRSSIHTFETQRAALKGEALKLSFFANADTLYRDYADFLIAAHRPVAALQLLDSGRARTLDEGLGLSSADAQLTKNEAVDAHSVARRLKASILFYSLGPNQSYVWAVTATRTQLVVLPKEADIEALVRAYQSAILKSADPLRDANPAASALYDALVGPVAAMIPANSRVFIIPDGVLNGLNFETLVMPGDDGSQYWIEHVASQNASSIRLLAKRDSHSSNAPARNLLLIGNPTATTSEYEALPNAAAEIVAIQKHFPSENRTVVTRAQALPAAYAANSPDRFAYIHFVAHGTASRLSPLDSAVVLSATPENADDFKLYARDIIQVPLHADLVVISACYSSGLRAYAGEGLAGLAWAFLRAGSHNVIGALWEASDASTPALMNRLYDELEAGEAPDAALRTAKLSLIHAEGVFRKPLYWGVFQLYAGS
jgi:CHAT domain-containing protein